MKQLVERGMFVRELSACENDAPTMLFVHGLGESGLCFEDVARHPALEAFTRIIVDLPGYGRSVWERPVPSLAALADRIAAFSSTRARSPVVLVGHSMGGVVAQLAAERHPGAFHAIIDVDGNLSVGDCSFSGRAVQMPLDVFEAGGFASMMEDIHARGIEDPAHRGYYVSLRLCDPRAYYAHSAELVELSRQERLAVGLATLSVPKLYVAGRPGGACDRSMELLREADVPVRVITPSGHWPFLDRPDDFVRAIVEATLATKT